MKKEKIDNVEYNIIELSSYSSLQTVDYNIDFSFYIKEDILPLYPKYKYSYSEALDNHKKRLYHTIENMINNKSFGFPQKGDLFSIGEFDFKVLKREFFSEEEHENVYATLTLELVPCYEMLDDYK